MKIVYVILFIMLLSCFNEKVEKRNLNKDISELINNIFKKDDSLCFISSNKEKVTYLVTKIDTQVTGLAYFSCKNRPVRECFSVDCKNTVNGVSTHSFSVCRISNVVRTDYSIRFENFLYSYYDSIGINTDTVFYISNKKYDKNRYLGTPYRMKDAYDKKLIHELYWNPEIGIIAYEYNDGTFWTRYFP